MFNIIVKELKAHAPFTFFGALTGIIFMFLFKNLGHEKAESLFYVFHPLHVLLSAIATAAMYKQYQCAQDRKQCNIFYLLAVGYVGAIGVATLSDSLMPYVGEVLLKMPHAEAHVGFLEQPLLINAMAIIGITIAYYNPGTKFPHYGHVLLSTWATLFHVIMAGGQSGSMLFYFIIFLFLFAAVWLPCCISDIVFPLLFVKEAKHEHK
ncbi:MAG: hypothetical protein L6416_11325 [Candidatus Omnitrophica bacterium]|nr:hypothetical protein [Candidatus Omnitrophota bacterium]